jgi:hypothetical protein
VRDRGVSVLDLNSNHRWIVLNAASEFTNLIGHGGGEEKCLPLRRELRDDLLNIWEEAHVAHTVSLVEDEILNPLEVKGASA